jgi:hypothetical protein
MEHLDLTDFFQTRQGALDFKSRLSAISEMIYKSDFNFEKVLMDQIGIQKKDKFLIILRDNNIALDSTAALKDFIDKLQEKISALQVFSLKLAFEPKEQTLKSISEWFILNTKKQVLLDISVDPKIVAGCDISFNGEYLSLSKKPVLDKIIEDLLTNSGEKPKADASPAAYHSLDHFSFGR